jgi:hypothetical protein
MCVKNSFFIGVNMIMNPDEFRRRIEPLAQITWRLADQPLGTGRGFRFKADNGVGATIEQLRLTPVKCNDCDIICTQNPRRHFQKRSHGWIEKCQECRLWRNQAGTWGDLPYVKIGRPSLTSDLLSNPVNSKAHQSLPIEHDANDSWSYPVDDQDHDAVSESDS